MYVTATVMAIMGFFSSVLASGQSTATSDIYALNYNDLPPDVHRGIYQYLKTSDLVYVARVNQKAHQDIGRDFLPWNQQNVDELTQACISGDDPMMFKKILYWLSGSTHDKLSFYIRGKNDVNKVVRCFSVIKELKNPAGRTIPFDINVHIRGRVRETLTPLLDDFGPVRLNLRYLESVFLGVDHIRTLCSALIRFNNVEELSFADNGIKGQDVVALAGALKENKSLLKVTLNVFGIPNTVPLAMALAEALKENKSLQQLHVRHVNFGSPGAIALAQGLKENNVLQQLELYHTRIGSAGALALAEALKRNQSLRQLSLELNQIDNNGAVAIAEALKENSSLRSLNLQLNEINSVGAGALADALKENSVLQKLIIARNPIGSAGAVDIASALKENKSLRYLDLSACNIASEGGRAFAEALKENRSLERLYVDHRTIGPDGNRALAEVLYYNFVISQMDPKLRPRLSGGVWKIFYDSARRGFGTLGYGHIISDRLS